MAKRNFELTFDGTALCEGESLQAIAKKISLLESVTKYKCSILQTEQNTTKRNQIQHGKIQKCQNTNTIKYKRTKYKLPKYKSNQIQIQ